MRHYSRAYRAYRENELTVMTEDRLTGGSGESFGTGSSFTYVGSDASLSVWDNNRGLAGDAWRNETGNDWQPATITTDAGTVSAGNVYAEAYHVLRGSDGRTYYLIEIEGTNMSNDESQDDVFAFYGAVPPTGVELTAVYEGNIYGSLHYGCLSGGGLFTPIAGIDDTFQTDQGADGMSVLGNLLTNDDAGTSTGLVVQGIDGSPALMGVWVDLPDGGRILVAANGDVTFDAGADFDALAMGETAEVTLTITISDGADQSVDTTLTVVVTGTNDGPVAQADDAAVTDTTGPITINVLANDTDVDTSDVLSIDSIDTTGTIGTVSINANGDIAYDGDAGFAYLNVGQTATDTFTYTTTDGKGGFATETVTVVISGSNGLPVANAVLINPDAVILEDAHAFLNGQTILDAVHDDEDSSADMLLIGTDATSALGVNLDMTSDRDVLYHADNTLDYLAQGETTTDTFTYTASDSNGELTSNTASVTITGENDTPVLAAALVKGLQADTGVFTFDLLEGASDIDNGAILSVASVTGLGAGMTIDGTTLTVDTGDAAFDSMAFGTTFANGLTYDVVDEYGAAASQTLDVTVSNGFTFVVYPIDPGTFTPITIFPWTPGGGGTFIPGTWTPIQVFPIGTAAVDDTVQGVEDTTLVFDVADLLANDADHGDLNGDGTVDGLTVTGVGMATGGAVSLIDGTITFVPEDDFHGEATFDYNIVDSEGVTSTATVTVQIAAVNDAPVVDVVSAAYQNDLAIAGNVVDLQLDLSDVDADLNPDAIITATVSADGMIMFLTGNAIGQDNGTVTGNGTDMLTFTGTVAQVDALIQNASVFTDPSTAGVQTITVTVDDAANGGPGAIVTQFDIDLADAEAPITGTVLADELTGGVVMYGAEGNDLITGTSEGYVIAYGGADHDTTAIEHGVFTINFSVDSDGEDTFVISDAATSFLAFDIIIGFEAGADSFDYLDLSNFGLSDGTQTNEEVFDSLIASGAISQDDASRPFGGVSIAANTENEGQIITLTGVELGDLTADDFIFV